jgi:hypothetical protein
MALAGMSLVRNPHNRHRREKILGILGCRGLLRLFLYYLQLFAVTTGLRRNQERRVF